jgi:hypothetical protein
MQSRSISFVAIGAICSILLLAPATAAAQSLLEAWAFAHYRATIPLAKFQAAGDRALVPPDDAALLVGGAETWTVVDSRRCVLRSSRPSGEATEYYLNNISQSRPTIYRSDDTFEIGFMGDEPIRCRMSNSGKQCDYFFPLEFTSTVRYRAAVEALNHIYANFCKYAR